VIKVKGKERKNGRKKWRRIKVKKERINAKKREERKDEEYGVNERYYIITKQNKGVEGNVERMCEGDII
jgi:hypothetical protein